MGDARRNRIFALSRGEQANVPVLVGSNEDEMRSLVARAMPVKRMQDYPQQLLNALGSSIRSSRTSDTATARRVSRV